MRTWEECECPFCIADTMTERKNSGILYVETFCFLKRDLGDCYEYFLSGHMCKRDRRQNKTDHADEKNYDKRVVNDVWPEGRAKCVSLAGRVEHTIGR